MDIPRVIAFFGALTAIAAGLAYTLVYFFY